MFKHYNNVSIVYHLKPNKLFLDEMFCLKNVLALPFSKIFDTWFRDIYTFMFLVIISVENSYFEKYFLETDDLFEDSLIHLMHLC